MPRHREEQEGEKNTHKALKTRVEMENVEYLPLEMHLTHGQAQTQRTSTTSSSCNRLTTERNLQ